MDLLVADAMSAEKGKRAAVLTGQDARAARYVYGIEAALYDNGPLVVAALDNADPRSFEIAVAGPAALLIAKLIKLKERLFSGKLDAKDAFEIYRLLQGDARAIAQGWLRAESEALSRPVAAVAEEALRELFAADGSRGAEIAGDFARGRDDPATVSQSARALAQELVATLAKGAEPGSTVEGLALALFRVGDAVGRGRSGSSDDARKDDDGDEVRQG